MSAFAVNLVDGLTSFVVVLVGLALGHHLTCDCVGSRRVRMNAAPRFLPGVR